MPTPPRFGSVRAQIIDPPTSSVIVTGTGIDDDLLGTPFNDDMKGAGGNDRLDGADGDDLLNGGVGADVLIGGAGIDTANYGFAGPGVGVNLALGIGTAGEAQGDTLSGIENVIGSDFADAIAGDAENNVLRGRGGADNLLGAGGNDRLNGGAGADTLDGGSGTDTADYLDDGLVLVDLTAGTAVTTSGIDTLTSIERVIGSQLADTLRGNGGDNVLDGAAGTDLIDGFAGNDRLEGGGGDDTLNGGAATTN